MSVHQCPALVFWHDSSSLVRAAFIFAFRAQITRPQRCLGVITSGSGRSWGLQKGVWGGCTAQRTRRLAQGQEKGPADPKPVQSSPPHLPQLCGTELMAVAASAIVFLPETSGS